MLNGEKSVCAEDGEKSGDGEGVSDGDGLGDGDGDEETERLGVAVGVAVRLSGGLTGVTAGEGRVGVTVTVGVTTGRAGW